MKTQREPSARFSLPSMSTPRISPYSHGETRTRPLPSSNAQPAPPPASQPRARLGRSGGEARRIPALDPRYLQLSPAHSAPRDMVCPLLPQPRAPRTQRLSILGKIHNNNLKNFLVAVFKEEGCRLPPFTLPAALAASATAAGFSSPSYGRRRKRRRRRGAARPRRGEGGAGPRRVPDAAPAAVHLCLRGLRGPRGQPRTFDLPHAIFLVFS